MITLEQYECSKARGTVGVLQLDFVLYDGDPDEGVEAIANADVLKDVEKYKEALTFPDVYGAIVINDKGQNIVDLKPDPILSLITTFVRALPYTIEGEPETVLLSESEHGFLIEPTGDEILISFFAGDAYDPEEYLLEQGTMKLAEYGEQVLSMGERMRDLVKKGDEGFFESDDYVKSLIEFLDIGRKALKTFKLEVERGLRMT